MPRCGISLPTGHPIGVFTDAPVELAAIAISQLGAHRRIATLEAGGGAFERLETALGTGGLTVRTRAELVASAAN